MIVTTVTGPNPAHAAPCKAYYVNGLLHRDHGPAIEWSNGTKEWYRFGRPHREDGPAIELAPGEQRYDDSSVYWLNGEKVECKDNEEFKRIVNLIALM